MKEVTQRKLAEKVFVGIDVHLKSYAVSVVEEGREVRKWTMPAIPGFLVKSLNRDPTSYSQPPREVRNYAHVVFSATPRSSELRLGSATLVISILGDFNRLLTISCGRNTPLWHPGAG